MVEHKSEEQQLIESMATLHAPAAAAIAMAGRVKAETLDSVCRWLERLAESTLTGARGGLGQMFADTQADSYRNAARILREHPEVIDRG